MPYSEKNAVSTFCLVITLCHIGGFFVVVGGGFCFFLNLSLLRVLRTLIPLLHQERSACINAALK